MSEYTVSIQRRRDEGRQIAGHCWSLCTYDQQGATMVDLLIDHQSLICLGEGEARDLAAGLALLFAPEPAPRVQRKRGKALPAAAGQPWSLEHDEELLRRWCAGEGSFALAQHFGRSRSAIRARVLHLGLEPEQAAATGVEHVGPEGRVRE